jgi:TatD DNase family protein
MDSPLYDAHLHLAASSLLPYTEEICSTLSTIGVQRVICNGTCPEDWPDVLRLARKHPIILPAVGLHPWKVSEVNNDWKRDFIDCLDNSAAAVGEIGLDQWIKGHDIKNQQDAFRFQLEEAAKRNRPVSIHCLRAVNPLMETLRESPLPERGVHLHAYNGPAKLVDEFLSLGTYFSFNAGQLKPGSKRVLENLRSVPMEKLLIETDAPDFLPIPEYRSHNLEDPSANHPANIIDAYRAIAQAIQVDPEEMAEQVAKNFQKFFGK